jgi:hypothetical protein
MICFSYD